MVTSPPTSASDNEWDAEQIKDWVVARSRPLLLIAGAVIVGGAVYVFWQQSVRLKNDRADTALATAQGSYYSGNAALAKSDLDKLITRYPGTSGATQGAMLLAQILYGESKHDEGIAKLMSVGGAAPRQFQAAVEELVAAGYADSGRPGEAAQHFVKAAERAQFAADQQLYRADAARMLMAAGKNDEARALWIALSAISDSPVVSEARVRLGEIDAKPATP